MCNLLWKKFYAKSQKTASSWFTKSRLKIVFWNLSNRFLGISTLIPDKSNQKTFVGRTKIRKQAVNIPAIAGSDDDDESIEKKV